jgi:hypothetical protein
MAGQTLYSNSVTGLRATPQTRASAGNNGGFGLVNVATDYVSPGATDDTTSVYHLVHVPSNARNLKVEIESHGTITTLTGDTTIYYSTVTSDFTGAAQGDSGAVNSLTGTSSLFGHATAMATADTPVDVTNKNGAYPMAARGKQLWDAAGLSSDPGGFFSIVFIPTSTNNLTAGATLGARVQYTLGR